MSTIDAVVFFTVAAAWWYSGLCMRILIGRRQMRNNGQTVEEKR